MLCLSPRPVPPQRDDRGVLPTARVFSRTSLSQASLLDTVLYVVHSVPMSDFASLMVPRRAHAVELSHDERALVWTLLIESGHIPLRTMLGTCNRDLYRPLRRRLLVWVQRIIFRTSTTSGRFSRRTEDEPSMQSLRGCNRCSCFVPDFGEDQFAAIRAPVILVCFGRTSVRLSLCLCHCLCKSRATWGLTALAVCGHLRRPPAGAPKTVTFCSVHLHNVEAKKRDAATSLLQRPLRAHEANERRLRGR